MIGNAVLYAASRATSNAIENVTRRVTWTVIAATFLLCGLVFALMLAFWLVEARIGTLYAAGALAAACASVGLGCLMMPSLIEWFEKLGKKQGSAVATVAAVDEEAREAVDYFGALQMISAAFLFGIGAARRLKR